MRVYSWEELISGHFASAHRIKEARDITMRKLREMHSRGWIESGLIFGSTTRGDFEAGSDVDVLIVAKPEFEQKVQRLLAKGIRIAGVKWQVEPQVILLNSKEARNGNHSISPFLLKHIGKVQAAFRVGNDPLKIIAFTTHTPLRTAASEIRYLTNKIRKIGQRLPLERSRRSTAYYKLLSQCVDASVNAARRVLDIGLDLGKKENDSKSHVVEKLGTIMGVTHPTTVALHEVVAASNAYKQAVRGAIKSIRQGKTDLSQEKMTYEAAIKRLERSQLHAEKFMRDISSTVRKPVIYRMKRVATRIGKRIGLRRIRKK